MPDELPENVAVVGDMPQVMVSSTHIRMSIAEDRNVNFLVPDAVLQYIKEKKLYIGDGTD